jgi:hypothetical protein
MFKIGDYVTMKHYIYGEHIMPIFKIKSIDDSKIRITDIITEITYLMVSDESLGIPNDSLIGIEEAADELIRYFVELEDYAKYNYNNLYTIRHKYSNCDDWLEYYKDFYEKTYRKTR